jgi:hypothetical protein
MKAAYLCNVTGQYQESVFGDIGLCKIPCGAEDFCNNLRPGESKDGKTCDANCQVTSAAAGGNDALCQGSRPTGWQGGCNKNERYTCTADKKYQKMSDQRWWENGVWKICQDNGPITDPLQTGALPCDWSSQCAATQLCDLVTHQCVPAPGNQNNYCATYQGGTWCEGDKRYQCVVGNNRQDISPTWCDRTDTDYFWKCANGAPVKDTAKKCVSGEIRDKTSAPPAPPAPPSCDGGFSFLSDCGQGLAAIPANSVVPRTSCLTKRGIGGFAAVSNKKIRLVINCSQGDCAIEKNEEVDCSVAPAAPPAAGNTLTGSVVLTEGSL